MRPTRVAILGGGMGGLSAAIHCRLHGADVVLIEKGTLGGKAAGLEIGGYRLDPGPSIVILIEIYRDLFARAGRRIEDYLRFERLDPISRVFFEGEDPISLPADAAACTELVSKLDAADGLAFARLMKRLGDAAPHIEASIFSKPFHHGWELLNRHLIAAALGFDGRLNYKQQVDRLFRSPLLRAFFYGFPSYGGQSYESKGAGSLLIPYYMLHSGVFYPVGGLAAIPAALTRLARELGVEFLCGEVTGLGRSGRTISSVEVVGVGSVEADFVISNIDRITTGRFLGRVGPHRPSYSYFTLHLGIRGRLEGLAYHNLIVPRSFELGFEQLYRERRVPDDPIIYVNCPPDSAPPGCTNLFAVVTVPACESHLDWPLESSLLRDKVLDRLGRLGWGGALDFERAQDPRYFESEHGNFKGSLYGVDESERPFGGLFPMKCCDEELSNLFYCGGSVQPGAGLPMVTLSGKFTADLVFSSRGRTRR